MGARERLDRGIHHITLHLFLQASMMKVRLIVRIGKRGVCPTGPRISVVPTRRATSVAEAAAVYIAAETTTVTVLVKATADRRGEGLEECLSNSTRAIINRHSFQISLLRILVKVSSVGTRGIPSGLAY